jgi:hypothetical protein
MTRRIALALVVVLMLVGVFVMVRFRNERVARAGRRTQRLHAFDERQVEGLVLATRGQTWRLVRAPSGWRILAPVRDVAATGPVEALVRAASRAPIVQTLVAPEALSTYGLEPPIARLTVEGKTTHVLDLGHIAPTGDGLFARLGDGPEVLLLGLPEADPLVEVDPASLRDRGLVDLARGAIVGIEVGPGGVQLARSSDGWWITSPHRFPALATSVDQLLAALYAAKVIGWDDLGVPSDAKYGLEPGALHITLRSGSDAQNITLGAEVGDGNRFVTSEGRGTILIANVPPPRSIPADLTRLRDPRLTNVNRYDVTRIDYVSGGERLSATRKDETSWITDTGGAVPAERVYTLLVALLAAETTAWSKGDLQANPTATLSYATVAGGAEGSLAFAGDRATWDALPGVVFRIAAPPPPVAMQGRTP